MGRPGSGRLCPSPGRELADPAMRLLPPLLPSAGVPAEPGGAPRMAGGATDPSAGCPGLCFGPFCCPHPWLPGTRNLLPAPADDMTAVTPQSQLLCRGPLSSTPVSPSSAHSTEEFSSSQREWCSPLRPLHPNSPGRAPTFRGPHQGLAVHPAHTGTTHTLKNERKHSRFLLELLSHPFPERPSSLSPFWGGASTFPK